MNKITKYAAFTFLGIVIVILDILTKGIAVSHLMDVGSIPVIDGIFSFTYVENYGVAFGMFQNIKLVSILFSIIVLIVLGLYFMLTKQRSLCLHFGTTLIFAGAIGNLIERISKGYVVDFLDFSVIHFPVFNVADIAVSVGAILLVIHFVFFVTEDIEKHHKEKVTDDDKI